MILGDMLKEEQQACAYIRWGPSSLVIFIFVGGFIDESGAGKSIPRLLSTAGPVSKDVMM